MEKPTPAAVSSGAAARPTAAGGSGPGRGRPTLRVLALPLACAAALAGFGLLVPQRPALFWSFTGAGALIVAWTLALYANARVRGRALAVDVMIRRQHWVQACAQGSLLLYWGWHVRFVYAFIPFIVAQLIFAYAVDGLITWSRRERYPLGFGPFPVIFSINLFLWFRPEWFYWQFAMILVGYAAKELIRWNRDGRSAHIFNPSSFPLAIASIALILTASSDITFGTVIATTQFYPPQMYLAIFLVSLPGQLLFGVARMTMSAVVTLYVISLIHLQLTGTYLFFDSHIPLPVFLGMHLLFTDPSTSPRSPTGRILFGVMYAVGTAAFFVILHELGVPSFYDKLLPVPLMNLTVRAIDRLVARSPGPVGGAVPGVRRLYPGPTALWAGIFVALSAVRGVGDRHPGQALPYWEGACSAGSARACEYVETMTLIYCNNGSGWACRRWGVLQRQAGRSPGNAFERACEMGFTPACGEDPRAATFADLPPLPADLPIVLRGTKPPLTGLTPGELRAVGCQQGWPGLCGPPPASG